MAKAESTCKSSSIEGCLNIDFMRSLVKQYSELGQWTSALFWADAAAAAAGNEPDAASGDDIWLLASAMLARGELHRAAHAVTSRSLHRRHLLCLGVAMRANLAAKEPAAALSLLEECDTMLLEPRSNDQTHNRALGAVLVWQARALSALERREASAEALAAALRADCACYEALDLLLEHHALTPRQESELIESLPISSQLSAGEGALVQAAYRERLHRHAPAPAPDDADCPIKSAAWAVMSRMRSAEGWRAARLAGACRWREALAELREPWACAPERAACLLELRRSADLFAFAHTLVDAYPARWSSWFAVGCYYYLIGKSELARRYLSKACSLEPSAGCVWLAYGHSFAADNEHDQAMAAYFKASQLMAGSHLPPLYVGVECSLLNNVAMCERFLARAAALHAAAQTGAEPADTELAGAEPSGAEPAGAEAAAGRGGWRRVLAAVASPHVAHEAGAAALAAGDLAAAHALWLRALALATQHERELSPRWAATLDALGHAARALGRPREALGWHERALALRPGRAGSLAALGLSLALAGREAEAARALHAALARDADDVVALALLDAIVDRLDAALSDEEIPQFPFPAVNISQPAPAAPTAATAADATNTSDMSMSFD